MDRLRHKQKKEKPTKYADKEKTHSFITDVKSIKENLKIKEILRTVKMNSSMRMKAPRGSKVMNSKDLMNEDPYIAEEQQVIEPVSAINPVMVSSSDVDFNVVQSESIIVDSNDVNSEMRNDGSVEENHLDIVHENTNMIENQNSKDEEEPLINKQEVERIPNETEDKRLQLLKSRERKLSLDHSLLTRRVSQSELDLHSIGKLPLERKSSFFRKRMDSFLKNTTEIFKRQSLNHKAEPVHRRGSMSASTPALNEKNGDLWTSNQVRNFSVIFSWVHY